MPSNVTPNIYQQISRAMRNGRPPDQTESIPDSRDRAAILRELAGLTRSADTTSNPSGPITGRSSAQRYFTHTVAPVGSLPSSRDRGPPVHLPEDRGMWRTVTYDHDFEDTTPALRRADDTAQNHVAMSSGLTAARNGFSADTNPNIYGTDLWTAWDEGHFAWTHFLTMIASSPNEE